MGVIVVDAAFKAKLVAAGGAAELRDEAGRSLGRLALDPNDPDLYAGVELELSEEEVARRLDPSQPAYTTEEVLAYVKGRRK